MFELKQLNSKNDEKLNVSYLIYNYVQNSISLIYKISVIDTHSPAQKPNKQ